MDLKEYIQKQKEKVREMPEKQYAIGEHIISQEQFNFIKGCFAENVLPPDFTIHRKTWGSGMPELPGIPDRPMVNCDVIKYKDTVFAEFNGYWEFMQESKINGIPPITSKDLSHIGKTATLSNDRQMLQWERWHQPDSLADFGIKNEINTSPLQKALETLENESYLKDLADSIEKNAEYEFELEDRSMELRYKTIAETINTYSDEIAKNDEVADRIMQVIVEKCNATHKSIDSLLLNTNSVPSNLANKLWDYLDTSDYKLMPSKLFQYIDGDKQMMAAQKYIDNGIETAMSKTHRIFSYGAEERQRLAFVSNPNLDESYRNKLFNDAMRINPSILLPIKNITNDIQNQLATRIVEFMTGERREYGDLHAYLYNTELNAIKESCPQLFTREGMKQVLENANEEDMLKIMQNGSFNYEAFKEPEIKKAIVDAIENTEYYKKISDPLYEPQEGQETIINNIKNRVEKLKEDLETKDESIKQQNIDENTL